MTWKERHESSESGLAEKKQEPIRVFSTAKKITMVDLFIRVRHQIDNLIKFI